MDFLFPLLILALLVPMFLGMRRQKKAMAEAAALQDSLQVGDRVLTTAGLHATVAALSDTTMDLEIAPGVVTTWSRAVVRERIVDEDQQDDVQTSIIEESGSSAVEYGAEDSRPTKD